MTAEIFILTHKEEIKTKIPKKGFTPLVCGNSLIHSNNLYKKDNFKANISELYLFYGKLTGQYWALKNSQAEYIGFCYPNSFFVKSLKRKFKAKDAEKTLQEADIILPPKKELNTDFFSYSLAKSRLNNKNELHAPHPKEWTKMRRVIELDFKDYLSAYDVTINSHEIYENNMFITNYRILNEYLLFAFNVLEKMRRHIESAYYETDIIQIGEYLGEILLNTYLRKHKLTIKEIEIEK